MIRSATKVAAAALEVEITELLSYRLSAVANVMSRGAAKRFRDSFEISLGEWRVLALLGAEQPRSLNQLARAANLDAGQVSRVVSSLIDRGLVLRDEALGAGRPVWLTLTAKGVTLYKKLIAAARERHEAFIACLEPEELEILQRALIKLKATAMALAKDTEVPSSSKGKHR